ARPAARAIASARCALARARRRLRAHARPPRRPPRRSRAARRGARRARRLHARAVRLGPGASTARAAPRRRRAARRDRRRHRPRPRAPLASRVDRRRWRRRRVVRVVPHGRGGGARMTRSMPPKPPEELSRTLARRILAQMGENGKPPELGISNVNVGNETYLKLIDDVYVQDRIRNLEGSSLK